MSGMYGKRPLLHACATLSFTRVKCMLDSGTPLDDDVLFAVICKDWRWKCDYSIRLLDLLLSHGADANRRSKDEHGWTPLQAAVRYRYADIVRWLIEKGKARLFDPVTREPVFDPDHVSLDVLRVLLDFMPKPTASPEDWATKVLFSVARNIHNFSSPDEMRRMVKKLVAAGVDINVRHPGEGGRRPLQLALSYHNEEAVRALAENGASYYDVETGELLFKTHHLLSSDLLALVDAGPKGDPWLSTALKNLRLTCLNTESTDLVVKLVRAGADVNVKDKREKGMTPLIKACRCISYFEFFAGLARFLLEEGADPNAILDDGRAALHVICAKGTKVYDIHKKSLLDCVSALLKHGADLDLCDERGRPPLQLAAQSGKGQVLQLILERQEHLLSKYQ